MAKTSKKPLKRQNGRGTIIDYGERAHLRYGARVTLSCHEGRQQYKYIGRWATRTEAATFLDLYSVGQYAPMPDITFEQLYKEWEDLHYRNISKQTADNYRAAYMHLATLKILNLQISAQDICKALLTALTVRGQLKPR